MTPFISDTEEDDEDENVASDRNAKDHTSFGK